MGLDYGHPQNASLGGRTKFISFTMTNTAKTIAGWLADGTAVDLDTGAAPSSTHATFPFDVRKVVNVALVGYTGTILYGGANSQPISWPANADFAIPTINSHNDTNCKTSASTFTVYAVCAME